jgi:hypothetical protein
MGKLREEFEGMDPELKDLIADGNHEIAQIEEDMVTADFEFPSPTRELTAVESADMDERIAADALIEKLFGIPAPNPVEVECHPLGVNGKPLEKVATISFDELVQNICKIVKLRMEGNAEIEKYFESQPASDEPRRGHFAKRLAEMAEDCGSPLAGFLRGYAEDSEPVMRRAVRHLLTSEAGSASL